MYSLMVAQKLSENTVNIRQVMDIADWFLYWLQSLVFFVSASGFLIVTLIDIFQVEGGKMIL